MKRSKRTHDIPVGLTPIQIFLVCGLISGVIFFFIISLGKNTPGEHNRGKLSALDYKSLSTPVEGIPLKVIVKGSKKLSLHKDPDSNSPTVRSLKLLEIFYIYREKNNFYEVGTDPFSGKTVGWIRKSEVYKWTDRCAIRLKQNLSRPPIYIWEQRRDVGGDNWRYKQFPGDDYCTLFPVFAVDGNHYKIALLWKNGTKRTDDIGAAQGWTSEIRIPTDAEIFYFLTKQELNARMQQVLSIIKLMKDEPFVSHPLVKFAREDLGLTFGYERKIKTEMADFVKRMTQNPSQLQGVLDQYPKEIRSEVRQLINILKKMEEHYQDPYNWDRDGRGWIPGDWMEDLLDE